MTSADTARLEELACELRVKLVQLCGAYEGVVVHNGGDLSAADTLVDAGVKPRAFRRLGVPQVYAGLGGPDELRDKYGFGLVATFEAARQLA